MSTFYIFLFPSGWKR